MFADILGRSVGFGVVAGGWLCGMMPIRSCEASFWCRTHKSTHHSWIFFFLGDLVYRLNWRLQHDCNYIEHSDRQVAYLPCRRGEGGGLQGRQDMEYSSFDTIWYLHVQRNIFIPEPTVRAWPYNQQCISTPLSSSKRIRRYALGKFLFPDTIVVL